VNSTGKFKTITRRSRLAVGLLLFLLPSIMLHAQEARKLKAGDPPEYPELARKLHIQGIAKIQITISPDGRVEAIKEVGGNPVLLDALTRAVKKWKYQPADKQTVIEVEFNFIS